MSTMTTRGVLDFIKAGEDSIAQAIYASCYMARGDRRLYEWSEPDAPREVAVALRQAQEALARVRHVANALANEWTCHCGGYIPAGTECEWCQGCGCCEC
jgi:hypothetical protein